MIECGSKCLGIALLTGVLGVFGAVRVAHANTNQCLLPPAVVPGLSGAPEWQDFDADGFWRPQLDDPRWAGGPLRYLSSLPVGGQAAWASQVAVRAVTVGRMMYVSFQAESDDNGPSEQDWVYVAFSQGNLAGAYAVAIDLRSLGAAISPPANPAAGIMVPADNPLPTNLAPGAIAYFHANNARTDTVHPAVEPVWGGENDGFPAWLKGARWDRPVLGGPRWAITLQIDLSLTGLNIGGPTNIFFGATVHTSTGDVIVGNATPKVGADEDKLDFTPIPKRSDLWPLFDEPGTACTGGITVDPNDVGVWTGTPGVNGGGTLTNQICAGSGCATTENTFRVIVRHVPNAGGISPWDLRARLRLANWSSQAYQNDAPWPDIAGAPTGSQITTNPSATAFTTANGWYWAPPVDAGDGTSSVAIDYKCTKGGAAYCPQLANMSNPQQAISVEISNPSALGTITKAATYRAIDFTVPAGGAGAGGAGAGGAGAGGAGGAASGGAGAGGSSGAATGGVPNGGASVAEGGSAAESEAGDTSIGGNQGVAGATNGSSGSSGAGISGASNDAGSGTAASGEPSDKGSSCGCRVVRQESSKLADFAALFALGVALIRRRKAQVRV